MSDGELFVIGGLIKDNVIGVLKVILGVGEVLVFGVLFCSMLF